ncbi:MAG: CDP-diacylglycerol--glycerol-3-phosphate 3-phosphatidyltransferase [Candidatus Marinimicrobia bacterium]|mgnify:FL=1|jgi:CDP-diacylglycerol--glycerol-3-phosphate 3-phosphatidyltransferase|nr:CDP-diacylglycerol--glycerol-3-phosphate 3-phosphatidyltransferase [Candidatus Neomarinimicrobiota bacterium]MBT4150179.1 CDP-diacylglycerol--glycerol-3-phosphate 3-phosphatidyltransferase [Candidatus Neomarinimicrobiota bacterium]MBT4317516.1 CDP-diacylglycerol--glycerol-3-phosphate 3-phosphatidyltransferase [Candidatus Neomarinimicrobiota bacterium]MBT4784647.1 CDP-diacylglycerol--glycerol-3-phosphate 3-phosphatidyltransferase [Candidatus Neomarinimicrobiota bacterium]MBT5096558.1 CDP-diac|tara:strand:- start:2712 stop:3296 length:585 start_codon:yes stop_codon:yes gene_type:complete
MMTLPNILTFFRILITPVFIVCLFEDFPGAHIWALFLFVIASITDAYDGYYARKNDMVTDTGRFLDPLADKILVSSAFISFAIMGLIDFWMVGLILFRDLFVTGLRIIMTRNGFTMMTSQIAKSKTGVQLGIIIFTLIFLSLKGLGWVMSNEIHLFILEYELVYYLTAVAVFFTLYTGISYVQDNHKAIKEIMN